MCVRWRDVGVHMRAKQRTATSAKAPLESMETPAGSLNWALVPTPLLEPAESPPATVVTSPVITSGGEGEGGGTGGG